MNAEEFVTEGLNKYSGVVARKKTLEIRIIMDKEAVVVGCSLDV